MVIEILKDRVEKGVFELNYGPYRNPWFLIKKKEKGKYRLVNITIKINRVIIRDANLPSSIDEFFEKFVRYVIAFLIDFFSDYDQIEFDEKSRDLTAFYTFIGLLRMTTLF